MGGGDVLNPLVKVRAVTSFIVLDKDSEKWADTIRAAVQLNEDCAKQIAEDGYTVQTLRLVTNPFGEFLDTSSKETALADMEKIKNAIASVKSQTRIRFAIGEARNVNEVRLIPDLVAKYADIANACVNVRPDHLGVLDGALIEECAKVVEKIAVTTPRGEGNFNFTVNFNCENARIPYFPAAFNTTEMGTSFALGFEHPDLLVDILKNMVPEGYKSIVTSAKQRGEAWSKAFDTMLSQMEYHTAAVVNVAHRVSKKYGVAFAGVDSSAAPSKDAPSLTEVVRLLGVEDFGAAGTSEASAYLTRLFKSVKSAPLIGFSGLMLACLEDAGLAECAIKGTYDIRALLAYSAMCGIGLDTVPIPGDTPQYKIEGLMKDVGAMAFRLNKPLTCRLFPVPGLKAGDITSFESADLCNCKVFVVP